jgi:hypothetical protein
VPERSLDVFASTLRIAAISGESGGVSTRWLTNAPSSPVGAACRRRPPVHQERIRAGGSRHARVAAVDVDEDHVDLLPPLGGQEATTKDRATCPSRRRRADVQIDLPSLSGDQRRVVRFSAFCWRP